MKESFFRTAMLLGEEAEGILASAHVVVFGVGGVGGHAAESLARCGVGRLTIVDSAVVKESNLNRQLCAEKATIGMPKVKAMKKRLEAVSDCEVYAVSQFVTAENAAGLLPEGVSAVIDAVDNVTAKIAIIVECKRRGVPVFSSMGAGNRLDPTLVRISDIYKTSIDPLARVMRRELKKRGVDSLTVAYSVENPRPPLMEAPDPEAKRTTPASVPFVPSVFGIALASAAVMKILEKDKEFADGQNTTI